MLHRDLDDSWFCKICNQKKLGIMKQNEAEQSEYIMRNWNKTLWFKTNYIFIKIIMMHYRPKQQKLNLSWNMAVKWGILMIWLKLLFGTSAIHKCNLGTYSYKWDKNKTHIAAKWKHLENCSNYCCAYALCRYMCVKIWSF